MNATSAACCGEDDDEDDDEDGEAADMEGTRIPPVMKQSFCLFQTACNLTHVDVFSEYEESGLLETDEVDVSKGRHISFIYVI